MEKKLDALIQQYACTLRSAISGARAECGHHYIGRRFEILRWDWRNIIPLTFEEHGIVHSQGIELEPPDKEFCDSIHWVSFKDYLMLNNWSKKEFMEFKKQELRDKINENNQRNLTSNY